MDKRTLYDEFNQVEGDIQNLLHQVGEMKEFVAELLEKNVTLEIENKHLRTRLSEATPLVEEEGKKGLSESRLNLEKIYEDGFHVCNVCYGSRRENDEECAFCLDVIYGERK